MIFPMVTPSVCTYSCCTSALDANMRAFFWCYHYATHVSVYQFSLTLFLCLSAALNSLTPAIDMSLSGAKRQCSPS